jgi:hypothetical protein
MSGSRLEGVSALPHFHQCFHIQSTTLKISRNPPLFVVTPTANPRMAVRFRPGPPTLSKT